MKPLLAVFAVLQLLTGALLWLTPGFFYEQVGPFGPRNDHYMGDLATWYLALGALALVAVRRREWRGPVLVVALLQNLLHAFNHLLRSAIGRSLVAQLAAAGHERDRHDASAQRAEMIRARGTPVSRASNDPLIVLTRSSLLIAIWARRSSAISGAFADLIAAGVVDSAPWPRTPRWKPISETRSSTPSVTPRSSD